MDCSPPGSSVRVILQARKLEWVAVSFSREVRSGDYWTFINKDTIDTTGAGDTFYGCALGYILRMAGVAGAVAAGVGATVGYDGAWDKSVALQPMDKYHMGDLLTYSNAAASIITTRKGAMMSMPTRDEITVFIINHLE